MDSLSVCGMLESTLKVPFLVGLLQTYKTAFPTLPSECPVVKGEYSVQNISNGNYDSFSSMRKNYGFLSDGIYKYFVCLYSSKDSNIYSISWETEVSKV